MDFEIEQIKERVLKNALKNLNKIELLCLIEKNITLEKILEQNKKYKVNFFEEDEERYFGELFLYIGKHEYAVLFRKSHRGNIYLEVYREKYNKEEYNNLEEKIMLPIIN